MDQQEEYGLQNQHRWFDDFMDAIIERVWSRVEKGRNIKYVQQKKSLVQKGSGKQDELLLEAISNKDYDYESDGGNIYFSRYYLDDGRLQDKFDNLWNKLLVPDQHTSEGNMLGLLNYII